LQHQLNQTWSALKESRATQDQQAALVFQPIAFACGDSNHTQGSKRARWLARLITPPRAEACGAARVFGYPT